MHIERFLTKIKSKKNGCWEWKSGKNRQGYGLFYYNNKKIMAHRFSYELFGGVIPNSYSIDHLCRNTSCVNPKHLEAVTQEENIMRGVGITATNAKKTHCKKGHTLTGENLVIRKATRNKKEKIWRVCRQCKNTIQKKWHQEKKCLT